MSVETGFQEGLAIVGKAENSIYREVQRFTLKWAWTLILAVALFIWYAFVQQVILGKPVGSKPATDQAMWILWAGFGIGLPVFFHSLKLVVELREKELYLRFFPFPARTVPYQNLKNCQAVEFSPLRDYGGYGLRWSPGKGWAYLIGSKRGVRLELSDGEKLLIGSQHPEKIVEFIEALKK
jgi:hypothetical protein